ncbi:MAG TPA: helix-turn-helix domain-containing protein [Solirubrobacteraceae bacterium]|nr:helix-turn-helix domain-containing protein [Solirubrobacteraceae bacterium]
MADSYGQYFCPITRASEIIATRWTPLIVRNLLLGCSTFSEIHEGAPGMPRSLLAQRLQQLEHAGVVARRPKPKGRGSLYELTPAGRELEAVCDALGTWGSRWLDSAPAEVDPGVLLWAICKSMDPDRLPEERVVVRVSFRDAPDHRFWLLVQRPRPEVCRRPPGFDEDLVVTSDTKWLARWHMGRLALGQAMHAGLITVAGPRSLVREFARWGGTTPFANVAAAR